MRRVGSARPAEVLTRLRARLDGDGAVEAALLARLFFSRSECAALARALSRSDANFTVRAILRGEAPVDPSTGAGEHPPFEADDPADPEVTRVVAAFYDSLADGVAALEPAELRFWLRSEFVPSARFMAAALAHPGAAEIEELHAVADAVRSEDARREHAQNELARRAAALARPSRLLGFKDDAGPRELLTRLVSTGGSVPAEQLAQFNYQFAYALLEDRAWLETRPWPSPLDASAVPRAVRELIDGLERVVSDRGRGVFETLLGAALSDAEFQTLAAAAIVSRLWNSAPEKLPDRVLLDALNVSPGDWREAVLARARASPAFARAAAARDHKDPEVKTTLEACVRSLDEAQQAARARANADEARGRASPLEVVRQAAFDPAMVSALKALWDTTPSTETARTLEALLDDPRAVPQFLELGMALAAHGDQRTLERLRSFTANAAVSPSVARLVVGRLEARLAPAPVAPPPAASKPARKAARRSPKRR